jgi:hypothetical protein
VATAAEAGVDTLLDRLIVEAAISAGERRTNVVSHFFKTA